MGRTVQDLMTRPAVTVAEQTPFKEIALLLDRHDISALPVVKANGRLVGVVSKSDLLLKEQDPPPSFLGGRRRRMERKKASATTAAGLMTAPAVSIGPDATPAEAARRLHQNAVKQLPVVDDDGRVVGMITRSDLLRTFLRPDEDIRDEIVRDVIEETLWIDPETVTVSVHKGIVDLEGVVKLRGLRDLLLRLAHRVEGVVEVRDRLSYEFDDLAVHPPGDRPWGVLPYGLRVGP